MNARVKRVTAAQAAVNVEDGLIVREEAGGAQRRS